MIPATLTLLVAASSTVLSVNALPIFSGFFASPAPASLARRDLTGAQLAQGSNAFFTTLLLEDICTPGQVGCINNNTATCSPEGNWEVTPCTGNSTCLALPVSSTDTSSSNSTVIVTCTTPATALNAIEQAGGSQELSVSSFNVTTAPFNATVTDAPTNSTTSTDTNTDDVPTATDSSTDTATPTTDDSAPTSTCTGDDGSDDGGDDGSDDGGDDGSDDPSTETDSDTDPTPTGTDASTDPTATCADDPSEPTETEFITVIAFPDPTDSNQFSYSTIEPTETDTDTLSITDPTPTDSSDVPDTTDTSTDDGSDPTGTDAVAPTPTDSGNSTVPCVYPNPQATSSDDSTDTDTDTATDSPTDTATDSPAAPTSTASIAAVVSGPVPDINTIGTFEIPATSTPILIRRGLQRKVRRSS